jgi:hypothetical protein
VNGNNPLNSVSQSRGALQFCRPFLPPRQTRSIS